MIVQYAKSILKFHYKSIENVIIIYERKTQIIKQVGESVKIDSKLKCFNINLSWGFSIFVDCYQNNEFILIQLIDTQSIIAYSQQSSVPASTKIKSIVNGTNHFIVYGQLFEKYSILSLFSLSFVNQSSLNMQFIDFDISIETSPNIYAITFSELFQLSIPQDSQFYFKSNFTSPDMLNFTLVNAYYNLLTYSQCDQIIAAYSEYDMAFLLGCENLIAASFQNYFLKSISKLLQNTKFILYQQHNKIAVLEKQTFQLVGFHHNHLSNSFLQFNSDNELFSFNSLIIAYKVQLSSLQVNLTNLDVAGNNYTFSLLCEERRTFSYSYISSINYLQVLSQNDTNIYVIFYFIGQFTSKLSGQLLQYKLNPDGIPLNFTLMTSKKSW